MKKIVVRIKHNVVEETLDIPDPDGMPDEELRRVWQSAMQTRLDGKTPPRWILVLGLHYARAVRDMEKRMYAVSVTMRRRLMKCRLLDARGIAQESDFLTPKYFKIAETGGIQMKNKRKGERRGSSRVTAGSVLIKILGAARVADDDSIIKEVKSLTESSKFDEKQLAWYKWKYRQGKLKGMDGKLHVINQGSPKKEPKARKKIVVKRKKK